MLKAINLLTIQKVASLSGLELKKEEQKKYAQELSSIINFFQVLKKIETDKVKPLIGSSSLENVMFADVFKESNNTQKILNLASKSQDNFIRTKAIL